MQTAAYEILRIKLSEVEEDATKETIIKTNQLLTNEFPKEKPKSACI